VLPAAAPASVELLLPPQPASNEAPITMLRKIAAVLFIFMFPFFYVFSIEIFRKEVVSFSPSSVNWPLLRAVHLSRE
jgi:hypothetical protein